ncbi:MAG: lysine--tRNA ligase [Spirochaetes bacterium GWF1_49_6]|nr:MAG: lysine--tRNA ligase [Spirochaetes bacterium GWF1_49_6]
MSEVSQNITDERKSRLAKLDEMKKRNINPYPNRYKPEAYSEDIKKQFLDNGEQEFKTTIAGRVMLWRSFGKAIFATIKDDRGDIQIYARKDILGDELFELFTMVDIGDIVGIKGNVFKTHKGEITLLVEESTLLAKAVNSLPEKWHGLSDIELRYRQRYLDLIINPSVKQDFIVRSKVIAYIRNFLTERGFIEVETPMMQVIPGGAAARPFITHHNALDTDLYLRIAPELYLKRLIVGGFERVFELNRNFRNEGIDTRHNPEFTMLELYQAYADYQTMMDHFEQMMKGIAFAVKGESEFEYQGKKLDFGNWKKLKYTDALRDIAGIDVSKIKDAKDAAEAAKSKGIHKIDKFLGKWGILDMVFGECVEQELIDPTIVYEYPSEISPLSKYKPDDPEFVERFEAYCMGRELCNAFSELNDPFVQRERFEEQARRKAGGDAEAMFIDEDYINALEHGMPPAGGLGIGIDRIIMFLIDTNSIRDTILFPTLKPKAE